MKKNTILKNF